MKRILFRVDAGGKIGLGHFYRTYNLACQLCDEGFYIEFVHLESKFWDQKSDFRFKHSTIIDEKCLIRFCIENQFDILYVDGTIDFSENNLNKLRHKTKVVFYQNLSDSRYLADVFILPSIHQQEAFYKGFNPTTLIHKGLEYFTFNTDINVLEKKEVKLESKVRQIGITSGGSDPKNVLLSIFELVDFSKFSSISFNFFIGENYMHKKAIPKYLSKNVTFMDYNNNNILDNDLLISTFGVSTYEFMSLGMPIMSVGHQESNTVASKYLAESTKSIHNLGLIDDINPEFLNSEIECLVSNHDYRKTLSNQSKSIIDHEGVKRVIDIIKLIE